MLCWTKLAQIQHSDIQIQIESKENVLMNILFVLCSFVGFDFLVCCLLFVMKYNGLVTLWNWI